MGFLSSSILGISRTKAKTAGTCLNAANGLWDSQLYAQSYSPTLEREDVWQAGRDLVLTNCKQWMWMWGQ
jgi:hypothetical protein